MRGQEESSLRGVSIPLAEFFRHPSSHRPSLFANNFLFSLGSIDWFAPDLMDVAHAAAFSSTTSPFW